MVIRRTKRTGNSFNKRDCDRRLTDNCRFCVKEIIPLCTFFCVLYIWHVYCRFCSNPSRLKYLQTSTLLVWGGYGWVMVVNHQAGYWSRTLLALLALALDVVVWDYAKQA